LRVVVEISEGGVVAGQQILKATSLGGGSDGKGESGESNGDELFHGWK
jgi:hypothetical protein